MGMFYAPWSEVEEEDWSCNLCPQSELAADRLKAARARASVTVVSSEGRRFGAFFSSKVPFHLCDGKTVAANGRSRTLTMTQRREQPEATVTRESDADASYRLGQGQENDRPSDLTFMVTGYKPGFGSRCPGSGRVVVVMVMVMAVVSVCRLVVF
jgi:hypothetical protein